MLSHTNVNRTESASISKAPFTFDSTLDLAGSRIAAGDILSLKVYVDEYYQVPFHMHSITQDGRVVFCDKKGTPVLFWQTYAETEKNDGYISGLLYNYNGVIAGHIVCKDSVVSLIRGVMAQTLDTVIVASNAFILMPQCHVAMLAGHCRSFCIDNQGELEYHTRPMTLSVEANEYAVPILAQGTPEVILGISNTADQIRGQAPLNGICSIEINGQTRSCIDSSIIIKPSMLSNLRVVKQGDSLTFKGVKDA